VKLVPTALQKKVKYDFPISAKDEKMNPNSPIVVRVAEYSTRVIACSASALRFEGTISVRTPLLAGADPDASGSKKPTNISPSVRVYRIQGGLQGQGHIPRYICQPWVAKAEDAVMTPSSKRLHLKKNRSKSAPCVTVAVFGGFAGSS